MSTTSAGSAVTPSSLRRRIDQLVLRDRYRLRRRLTKARDKAAGKRIPEDVLLELAADVEEAERRLEARRAAVPKVTYPPQLPVSKRVDDLAKAIAEHQVVVVAGETGSGKTTQLPKICLDIGRGVHGMIGHTQPRRIAARTVAERIADELDTELGTTVGWQVRFTDQVSDQTLVKVMTDGILLAEIQRDRMLRAYDTIIIDEAHERSLNIDFLLGYLKRLLPKRPDLKLIITSATIDPERFAQHFASDGKPAPIVEVSGRTYPVEVRYRPVVDPEDPATKDRDQIQAICDAVQELQAEGPGDILVFLSGEREIRDTADALQAMDLPGTEILPLYSRLAAAEQHRVFQPHRGRRIVLATNVAETSLTVPGIKYVIDPGTARISRYSHRLKVQRLPIEPISQASANQRKGRCGRTSDGICIRLYSEEDFASRPEFTDPEILRTNLASVLLQMAAAELGDIADFPFIDPPDRRQVADGLTLLRELGALDGNRLTPIGRKLARLPVDPRMARMVVEAHRNGCLHEVLVIASALSIQDPRERPAEHQQAADALHARFADETSDFLSYLNLWDYLRQKQRELSSSKFRKLCKQEYLNYVRVREWQDLYAQLKETAKQVGITAGKRTGRADYQSIHTSLLAGLLSHIGLKDPETRDFLGARNARFAVFPGSALFRKTPRWVVAAELVETSRLWGRICARIEPEWVESLAGHLVKRRYAEPHWERKRGAVMALETVTLYGVPLVSGRKVNYARIDPGLCRELFIRHALVEGDWDTHHEFFHANRKRLEEAEELEHRARRRDILVDDQALFEFYDARIPDHVVSAQHFDSWWKKERKRRPRLLDFDPEMLVTDAAADISDDDYPEQWRQGELELPLTYQFEPGSDADGVTVHLPLEALNQVDERGFEWLVPGMRHELITALIKTLPKQLRRQLVPAPDTAMAVQELLQERQDQPLLKALSDALWKLRGVDVPVDAWDLTALPDHLRMTFRVVDGKGRTLGESKDLGQLRQRLAPKVKSAIARAAEKIERRGVTSWDFGDLPQEFTANAGGSTVQGYPALTDAGDAVDVRVYPTVGEQRAAMRRGTRKLVLLSVPSPKKMLRHALTTREKLQLAQNPHGSVAGLLDDCIACAADHLIAGAGGPAWDADGFAALVQAVRAGLGPTLVETVERVRRVLVAWHDVRSAREAMRGFDEAMADIDEQVAGLVYDGFVADTGFERLPDVERYLRAVQRRLEKLPRDGLRDAERMRVVRELTDEYRALLAEVPPGHDVPAELAKVRWMLEELRVSFFAQTLGTAYPVSEKRILRALDAIAG
ncbi:MULTISPECIES: ATP-dependent RNA helicase HrpA [Thermocrispum]|jgi:ATP-dependent helicase HrpA|uniref:RNA helicase n=2 Tax=Thermocrispum agreste TaxID=37925 RepID=A0A2W4LK79_9PSEU|nr:MULTISPECIES: ATP-dependent RNA helicase HrpA [Thermocrispum]PZN01630.1 MAG: ATP-dependent RNA helicase HrpA [Thermocrispum agreste]